MRTTMIATILGLTACGGGGVDPFYNPTSQYPPQDAHEPANVEQGYLQCLSQEQGGTPVSLPDGGVFYPASLPDGAVVSGYLSRQQCQVYFADEDAGIYTGP